MGRKEVLNTGDAARLLLTLLAVVLVSEAGINAAVDLLKLPILQGSILNALLLIALAFPVLYIIIFRPLSSEIRARIDAENELREALDRADLIFRTAPCAIIILDKNTRIHRWNDMAAKITGYSAEEVIGKDCLDLIGLPCNSSCEMAAKGSLKPTTGEECQIKAKDGRSLTVLRNRGYMRDGKGNIIGSIESFEDITARKKLTIIKDEFIGTVSHELRTPLSIAKEGVSLVLDRIPGPINEEQAKILSAAKNNIDRLARIINSMLDISKIESGRPKVCWETFDILPVIRGVITDFGPILKQKELQSSLKLPEDRVLVEGDSEEIGKALSNLIRNSLRFTEKGSIDVLAIEEAAQVSISVTDTGIGVAPENLPKLFEKFRQFGRVDGPGEKGTGLGLAITRGIIESHGGKIRVESEIGKGTKITFTLPKRV